MPHRGNDGSDTAAHARIEHSSLKDAHMAYDTLEQFGSASIQHGVQSDRVYLMKLGTEPAEHTCERMLQLAQEHGYAKLFAKLPATAMDIFRRNGFVEEARIPGLYRGSADGIFAARYMAAGRNEVTPEVQSRIEKHILLAQQKTVSPPQALSPPYVLRVLRAEDMAALAGLYRTVFASYPFPIHDPAYLEESMNADAVRYFGIHDGETLVAAASAEMDHAGLNTEMTDFATLPSCRGKGFAQMLLRQMEGYIVQRRHTVVYTIARSMSAGMNITFARCGYRFAGTLINNTQIAGKIESMNVWYRKLFLPETDPHT